MSKKVFAIIVLGFIGVLVFGMLIGGLTVRTFFPPSPQVLERELETMEVITDEEFLRGVVILEVLPDSPAEEAGIEPGDQVISVDDEVLDEKGSLAEMIQSYKVGDEVEIIINREGQEISFFVELAPHPDDEELPFMGVVATPFGRGPLVRGFTDRPFDGPHFEFRFDEDHPYQDHHFKHRFDEDHPFHAPRFHFSEDGVGLIIMNVAESSPAESAGLQPGHIVVAIEDEEISSFEQLADIIAMFEPGDEISLVILRAGEEIELVVELGNHPEKSGRAYLGIWGMGFDDMMPEDMHPRFDFENQG